MAEEKKRKGENRDGKASAMSAGAYAFSPDDFLKTPYFQLHRIEPPEDIMKYFEVKNEQT